MDGVDPQAFASVFANSMIIIAAGAVCAYLGMSRFFSLRTGSIRLFVVYILARAAVWSFYDTLFFFGIDSGDVQLSWAIVMAALSIITYGVLYMTWNASILKIGLVGLLVDSVSGVATVIVLAASSLALSGEVILDYAGYVRPQTPVIVVGQIIVFMVLIWVASPIGRFICNHQFKHERLWTVLFTIALVFAVSTRTQVVYDSGVVFALMAVFAAVLIVPHALWRGRTARRQRMLLARTQALTRAYDDSLRNQAEFLAESKRLLDELAIRIESVDAGSNDRGLAEHVDALRKSCDELRYGAYSDNPALDVMLVSWEDRFRSVGVPVEYRIAPLAQSGAQVALAVQALFEWVFRECTAASSSKRKRSQVPERLCLRVFRSANQLLIELRIAAWDGPRFPQMRISERMPARSVLVREFSEGEQRVIRVIIEEGPPWNL